MERKRNWETEEGIEGVRERHGERNRGSGEEEERGDGGRDGRGGRERG